MQFGSLSNVGCCCGEHERNEDIVPEDEHESKILMDDVPGGEHLLLVIKIVKHIQKAKKLIGYHPHCNLMLFFLQEEVGKIVEDPESHGWPVGEKLIVQRAITRVQFHAYDKSLESAVIAVEWVHAQVLSLEVSFDEKVNTQKDGKQKERVQHLPIILCQVSSVYDIVHTQQAEEHDRGYESYESVDLVLQAFHALIQPLTQLDGPGNELGEQANGCHKQYRDQEVLNVWHCVGPLDPNSFENVKDQFHIINE